MLELLAVMLRSVALARMGAAVFFGLARRMKIAELDLVLDTLRARLHLTPTNGG